MYLCRKIYNSKFGNVLKLKNRELKSKKKYGMSWNFSSSMMIIFLTAIYLISFLFRPYLYDIAKYLSNILYLLTVGCFIEKYVAKKKKSLARQKRILTINIHKFISLV